MIAPRHGIKMIASEDQEVVGPSMSAPVREKKLPNGITEVDVLGTPTHPQTPTKNSGDGCFDYHLCDWQSH